MASRQTDTNSIPTKWLIAGVSLSIAVVSIIVFLSYWLQPPVVAITNLRYIQSLRTAVSSQRPDYVNKVDEALKLLKDKGELSEPEWAHFQMIIGKARAGDWQAADQACMKWENAQSDRVREAGDDHDSSSHGHTHPPKIPPSLPPK
ncbi:MAG: hypothetical protein MUC83_04215 [Pirellula sp.]|jgi:hypothetical protein|nr:hypothetical protein [Pirellula sp.]